MDISIGIFIVILTGIISNNKSLQTHIISAYALSSIMFLNSHKEKQFYFSKNCFLLKCSLFGDVGWVVSCGLTYNQDKGLYSLSTGGPGQPGQWLYLCTLGPG